MDAKRDFFVGLAALLGTGGLLALLFVFGEVTTTRVERIEFTLSVPDAQGVTKGSPVLFTGVRVGSVRFVELDMEGGGVLVGLRVDRRARIPRDVRVSITSDFIGDTHVRLVPRPREDRTPPADFIEAGDTIAAVPTGLFDEIMRSLNTTLDERLMPFAETAEAVSELSATYTNVGELAAELLRPVSPDRVDAGEPPTIATVVARLDAAAKAATTLIEEQQVTADLSTTLERVRTLADEVASGVDRAATSVEGVRTDVAAATTSASDAIAAFADAMDTVSVATDQVRLALTRLNTGKGTAGQLLVNPDLYHSLDDAAERLDQTLIEAQLLIQKWRSEGLPIQL
ncbi:MAG: MlaD family protein [Planctomycetota bacterium]